MNEQFTPCRRCGTAKDGAGELCVSCFFDTSSPCPECTYRTAGGQVRIRRGMTGARTSAPVDCAHCNNERWIMLPYEPFVPPAKRVSKADRPR